MMDPVTENQEKLALAGPEISLERGEVHLWYAQPTLLEEPGAQAACLPLLSVEETQRCRRFVHERDQLLYLTAHTLLRRVLSCYGKLPPQDWCFTAGSYGKPSLANADFAEGLRFNLSHTHGLVACAICRDVEVGVDVESLERNMSSVSLAERYFSAAECECLRATSTQQQETRFLQFWTLKEAYIKAVGAGLSIPLESFSMQLPEEVPLLASFTSSTHHALPPVSIRFHDLSTSAAVEKLAAFGQSRIPAEWQFAQFTVQPNHLMALAVQRGACADFTMYLHAANKEFLTTGKPLTETSGE